MSSRILLSCFLGVLGFSAMAQTQSKSGVDLGAMDTSVSPCNNFYQYACGTWQAHNPIPPDKPRWGRFDELSERNLEVQRDILQKAAQPGESRSALDRQLGDYYAACMDEQLIEKKGVEPIKPELDRINGLADKKDLAALIGHMDLVGVGAFFNFGSEPDLKNASINIGGFDQGGISLPDRDYYLKDDQRSKDLREKYQQHVVNMFDLLAKSEGVTWDSKAKAAVVLKVETALAKNSLDRVARRNPDNLYHPMQAGDLPSLTSDFDWKMFLQSEGPPPLQKINVAVPDFFKGLDPVLASTSLDDIKTYLTWRLLLASAGALPRRMWMKIFSSGAKPCLVRRSWKPAGNAARVA